MKAIVLLALLGLTGCWNADREHLTLKYSRFKGSGVLSQELGRIHCEDKGKSCGVERKKELEDLREKYERWLKGLGLESVKVKLSSTAEAGVHEGTVSAKFLSLAQLPLLKETRIQFIEEENRQDLVLEMEMETKGDFKAEDFSFTFQSTDDDASIMEHYPPGKLEKDGRTVTWEKPTGFVGRVVYRIRLKGKALKEN